MTFEGQNSGLSLVEKPQNVEASLWRRFRYDDDLACRERLFNSYKSLANQIARKQFSRRPSYGLEFCDFEQFAFTGLLEAMDRFDPLKNVPFQAYARYRILGSITDGLSHSSEGGAQYSYKRRMETERLRSLKVSNSDEDALTQISNLAVGLALGFILEDVGVSQSGVGADPAPNAYETLSWRELQAKLTGEIENLPSIEKTVIKQHYLSGVAFVQIAQLLNLSKGRVSQLHKSAVIKLKRRIGNIY
ncbi:sigma-70 family RNA polymerase sigma factor [Fretibacter rubidus]|uniref:sigma-70 family RNA polymerase sigma factor n=1 Tax=Fretibacter rubidus TaxID=570162 RepID=UPI00352A0463